MGVYINMEMPDKCGHCRFATAFECEVTKNFITTFNVRQVDCPLVPIQPHGRLIDADKIGLTNFEIILCQKGNPFKNALEMLLEKIENAPTVIPASEEGE